MNEQERRAFALMEQLGGLDPALIEEAERYEAARPGLNLRPARRRVVPRLLVAALLVATLGLGAAASGVWDGMLQRFFDPSPQAMDQMREAVELPDVTADCGGTILHVRQTLGDVFNIYFNLDITLPKTVDLAALTQDLENGWTIRLGELRFFTGSTDWDEVKELRTQSEIDEYFRGRRHSSRGSISVFSEGGPNERGTLSYLVGFTAEARYSLLPTPLTDQPLTLVIDDISLSRPSQGGGSPETKPLVEGPLVVSWEPKNSGPVYLFTIPYQHPLRPGDEPSDWEATVVLSSLSIDISFPVTNELWESYDDFARSVRILDREGNPIHIGSGSGGSYTGGDFRQISYTRTFREVLVMDEVGSIVIGDFVLELADGERID
ncbi:MAG: hypothetical protein IJC43_06930 [Clostridia bacterium]|nr:hypothetical protein [Clostridia bacterium]